MTNINNDQGFRLPNSGNAGAGGEVKDQGEQNYFHQAANKITGNAESVANVLEQVPVVGGLWGAEVKLAGEVAALPYEAQGAVGELAGGAVQLEGKVIKGGYDLVGGAYDKVSEVAGGVAEMHTQNAEKVANVLEKVPVIGGLWGAEARLAGQVAALPAKAVSAVTGFAGDVAHGIGDAVGGAYEAAGKFISKL